MRISAALPHGVSALFAASARRRRELEAALVRRLEDEGFEEVVLPIVDYLEPYEPLLTPASRRELYQFVDRDGELLALRADFTPMLARLVAPRLDSLDLPLSVYYRGDVVRFQEERAGRLREFYQLGAELLGVPGREGEERILRLFVELLGRMAGDPAAGGAGRPRRVDVVLGFAGALDPLFDSLAGPESGAPDGGSPARLELADALARRDRERLRRAGAEALLQVAERGAPEDPSVLGEAAEGLAELLDLRDRLARDVPGVHLTVDLAEFATQGLAASPAGGAGAARDDGEDTVWGRSYYDGIVFRAYLGRSALPVGGGGRYDRLFRALGAEVPAVGFSLGLDRLSRLAAPSPDAAPDRAAEAVP